MYVIRPRLTATTLIPAAAYRDDADPAAAYRDDADPAAPDAAHRDDAYPAAPDAAHRDDAEPIAPDVDDLPVTGQPEPDDDPDYQRASSVTGSRSDVRTRTPGAARPTSPAWRTSSGAGRDDPDYEPGRRRSGRPTRSAWRGCTPRFSWWTAGRGTTWPPARIWSAGSPSRCR